MAEIFEKINAIMRDITAIGKDKQNKQQGFKYRGIDDVMNALFPLLSKHGVFVVPEVLSTSRTERQSKGGGNIAFTVSTVKYTFYATDGSSVSAITTGEGMDSADKSTNKAMAAAMKYAFFQTFCIPTEEASHDDPDEETPPPSVPRTTDRIREIVDNNLRILEQAQREFDCACAQEGATPPIQEVLICAKCKSPIKPTKTRSAKQVAESTKERYGQAMCSSCANQEQRELDAIAMESLHDDAGDRS